MKASCTFPSCPAKYSFTMQSNPTALDQDVKLLVQQTGDIQHKLSEKKARQATKPKKRKNSQVPNAWTQPAFLQHTSINTKRATPYWEHE